MLSAREIPQALDDEGCGGSSTSPCPAAPEAFPEVIHSCGRSMWEITLHGIQGLREANQRVGAWCRVGRAQSPSGALFAPGGEGFGAEPHQRVEERFLGVGVGTGTEVAGAPRRLELDELLE